MQSGAMTRMQLYLSLFGLSRQVCVCVGGGGGVEGRRGGAEGVDVWQLF